MPTLLSLIAALLALAISFRAEAAGELERWMGEMGVAEQVELAVDEGSIRVAITGPVDAELEVGSVTGAIRAVGRRLRQRVRSRLEGLRPRAATGAGSTDDAPHSGHLIPIGNQCGGDRFHLGIIRGLPCLPSGRRWLQA